MKGLYTHQRREEIEQSILSPLVTMTHSPANDEWSGAGGSGLMQAPAVAQPVLSG